MWLFYFNDILYLNCVFVYRGRSNYPTHPKGRGDQLSEFGSILQEMIVESHPSSAIKQKHQTPSRTIETVQNSKVVQVASERKKGNRQSQGDREDWRETSQVKKTPHEYKLRRQANKSMKQKSDSEFSAAVDALKKLDISTLSSSSSIPGTANPKMAADAKRSGRQQGRGNSGGDAGKDNLQLTSKMTVEERGLREGEGGSSEEVEQELSPSLNTKFKTVSRSQQQQGGRGCGIRGRSPRTQMTPTSSRIADSERNAMLKNLLHIDSSSSQISPGVIGYSSPESDTSASLLPFPISQCPQPHTSEAIMRLMRPPRGMNSPFPSYGGGYSPHQCGTFFTRYPSQPLSPWSGTYINIMM